jgi:adenine-specific DNA-methyltransferase
MSGFIPSASQLDLFDSRDNGALQCTVVNEGADGSGEHSPKILGAYYTDSQVAEFLVWWAIRSASDTVLDPAFGGGVFLRAACRRLREAGGNPGSQVFGIELDPAVHQCISEKLHEDGVAPANLLASDFFAAGPERVNPVDAIVGNPPFIRYQRFSGDVRRRALARAAEQGLKLSELSSSWLPFLVHSIRFLRPGGRIAMVIPFEIGHASYALPFLKHLDRTFESVTFLTFRKKLFPALSQDTLLLLAEGKESRAHGQFYVRDLADAGALAEIETAGRRPIAGLRRLDRERVSSGRQRLVEYLLPRNARELYRELCNTSSTATLGNFADVGIGYVTGANDFFHLDPEFADARGIPAECLRPCVCRGRALAGLRFSRADWTCAVKRGDAGYLLNLQNGSAVSPAVARYLAEGETRGVHKTFKCRTRSPWYRVPHVYMPDAFLTYMSGDMPHLVANAAGAVAPNTLHVLRLHQPGMTGVMLAALWQTSLTRLSVEIEGHAMGGGMLKLEPTEAERVLMPGFPKKNNLEDMAVEMDRIARSGDVMACQEYADRQLLRRYLGLSTADFRLLRDSALLLRQRRNSRAS